MKICQDCKNVFISEDWHCDICGHRPKIINGMICHSPEFAHKGGGFKPESFSQLAEFESKNFWFQARNTLILWALEKYKPNANTFLEIGCGTGFVLSGIASERPDLDISGSEIFLNGLAFAQQRVPSAKLHQMDARRIPYVDEFDVIGAFDVLEHIKEDEFVLREFHQALKSEGILLLTVPQHPFLWSASDKYACHVRRYTRPEIENKISDAGFKILRSTSFVTSLLPLMMTSRLLSRVNSKDYDPLAELKINQLINKTLLGLMNLEIAGIKIGLNYPVGGSRLIVAEK